MRRRRGDARCRGRRSALDARACARAASATTARGFRKWVEGLKEWLDDDAAGAQAVSKEERWHVGWRILAFLDDVASRGRASYESFDASCLDISPQGAISFSARATSHQRGRMVRIRSSSSRKSSTTTIRASSSVWSFSTCFGPKSSSRCTRRSILKKR